MKFYTHKISTGNKGDFSQLVKQALGENKHKQTKTASSSQETIEKSAADDDYEQKRQDKHWVEGSPSDDNGEAETGETNKEVDPAGLDSGKETMSEDANEKKVAMHDYAMDKCGCCEKCGTDECTCEECNMKHESKKESHSNNKKKSSNKKTQEKTANEGESGEPKGEGKGDDIDSYDDKNEGRFPEPDRGNSDTYDQTAEDENTKGASRDESPQSRLEKIANLSPKAKKRLKTYWGMVYPTEYANAMVQDK